MNKITPENWIHGMSLEMKAEQVPNIGVVGCGFVGSAVRNGFSPNVGCAATVRVYDKDPNKATHTLEETVNKSDFLFVSVPTPANPDGTMNSDILFKCINEINDICTNENLIILIRSTVVPGTTEKIQNYCPNLKIVFNPEFLTERSANYDFINQSRFIIGGRSGDDISVKEVEDLYRWRFGKTVSIVCTDYQSAEMVKYMTNTFFATKISFLNDMYLLCDAVNANWEDVMEGFVRDGRVGHTHLGVPGHDGKFGFGGSCFPKDIQAVITFAEEAGIDMAVLKGAWATNLKVRPEKDWEKLEGRATVKQEETLGLQNSRPEGDGTEYITGIEEDGRVYRRAMGTKQKEYIT